MWNVKVRTGQVKAPDYQISLHPEITHLRPALGRFFRTITQRAVLRIAENYGSYIVRAAEGTADESGFEYQNAFNASLYMYRMLGTTVQLAPLTGSRPTHFGDKLIDRLLVAAHLCGFEIGSYDVRPAMPELSQPRWGASGASVKDLVASATNGGSNRGHISAVRSMLGGSGGAKVATSIIKNCEPANNFNDALKLLMVCCNHNEAAERVFADVLSVLGPLLRLRIDAGASADTPEAKADPLFVSGRLDPMTCRIAEKIILTATARIKSTVLDSECAAAVRPVFMAAYLDVCRNLCGTILSPNAINAIAQTLIYVVRTEAATIRPFQSSFAPTEAAVTDWALSCLNGLAQYCNGGTDHCYDVTAGQPRDRVLVGVFDRYDAETVLAQGLSEIVSRPLSIVAGQLFTLCCAISAHSCRFDPRIICGYLFTASHGFMNIDMGNTFRETTDRDLRIALGNNWMTFNPASTLDEDGIIQAVVSLSWVAPVGPQFARQTLDALHAALSHHLDTDDSIAHILPAVDAARKLAASSANQMRPTSASNLLAWLDTILKQAWVGPPPLYSEAQAGLTISEVQDSVAACGRVGEVNVERDSEDDHEWEATYEVATDATVKIGRNVIATDNRQVGSEAMSLVYDRNDPTERAKIAAATVHAPWAMAAARAAAAAGADDSESDEGSEECSEHEDKPQNSDSDDLEELGSPRDRRAARARAAEEDSDLSSDVEDIAAVRRRAAAKRTPAVRRQSAMQLSPRGRRNVANSDSDSDEEQQQQAAGRRASVRRPSATTRRSVPALDSEDEEEDRPALARRPNNRVEIPDSSEEGKTPSAAAPEQTEKVVERVKVRRKVRKE